MNHRLINLFCLSWTLVLGMALFTACSDNDKEWMPSPEELDIREELPTTDQIEARLTRDVALLGSDFGPVTQKVLDRVTGMRHLLDPLNTTASPKPWNSSSWMRPLCGAWSVPR